jgi:hypothetical protein
VAVLEKLLHLFLADVFRGGWRGAGEETKKRVQICPIGGDRVPGESSLDGQMLEKELKKLYVIDVLQRRRRTVKNKRPNGEPSGRAG